MSKLLRIILLTTLVMLLGVTSFASSEQDRVASAPTDICPILVGSPLPDITLKDLSGKSFDLNKAIAAKPTILIYFRGGW